VFRADSSSEPYACYANDVSIEELVRRTGFNKGSGLLADEGGKSQADVLPFIDMLLPTACC
jgi:hypothetical protein